MKLSLRMQIVALVAAMLVAAMGLYVALATRIVRSDKEATLYDVDALLAASLSNQLRTTLDSAAGKLRYFGEEQVRNDDGLDRRAKALFDADDQVLSLEIFQRKDGAFRSVYTFTDAQRLGSLNLSREDLEAARKASPVPVEAVAAGQLLLQNASLAPDLALLRIAAATRDGNVVAVADVRPEALMNLAGNTGLYSVLVVDSFGRAVVHPDPAKVLGQEELSALPVVKDALADKVARGTREYAGVGGAQAVVAAWARVDAWRLAVIVQAPRDEAMRATDQLAQRSVLFAVGVVSVALLAAIFFSRRVTAPLRSLERVMVQVARGELGATVAAGGSDELVQLSRAFNAMSTELKARAEELELKNQALLQSEKLSAIGELSAGLAHEVKNPMVGIVGFSQLGLEGTSLEEAKEYFKLIESDAQRANGILQNLLDFARPPEVVLEPLELNAVVQGAVRLCAHALQLTGVKLSESYAEGLPPIVGNNNQLRQVLLNLMMNAAQAMESSPVRRLSLTTSRAGDRLVVKVSDTGPGISPEARKRIFEPFFTTKPRGKGTGLGLSVSASIIEAHQGTLSVESAPGEGATFTIALRLR